MTRRGQRHSGTRLEEITMFGDLLEPQEAMQPILARPVRDALMAWLTEIWAEEELQAVGLAARKRALFRGAPGVGKTTLAHHLSGRLGLRMLAVRPETLIDKWVGSTGRNIGSLFDLAAATEDDPEPIVLFFDEFDAIAVKRVAATQGAEEERNSFVNVLLQRIERHEGYIIAATNFGDHIDPAIWRRFDIHIALDLPGPDERGRILARYLKPYGLPRAALAELGESFATASPALMRAFCEGLKRNIVLGPRLGWTMTREATIGRLVATVEPHPDLGKPRLWSHGAADQAVRKMPWPLPLRSALKDAGDDGPDDGAKPTGGGEVVKLEKRK
jgi:hypothetical protein